MLFEDHPEILEQLLQADVISFDIFDTLVTRPLFYPADLFYLIEYELNRHIASKDVYPFHDLRIAAENMAREKTSSEEITLDEIYACLADISSMTRQQLELAKKREVELEIGLSSRRQSAFELYQYLKARAKKIIFVSDMYLGEDVIRQILQKNGYDADDLYLSSSHGKMKRTGKLYDVAFKNYSPDKIVHIGDNYYSDYKVLNDQNITAWHIPSCVEYFRDYVNRNRLLSNELMMNIPDSSLGIRTCYALMAIKYFDNNPAQLERSPDFIGYTFVGVYLYSFIYDIWQKSGCRENLVFCSRDGYLPLKGMKILKAALGLKMNIKYFIASRMSLLPLFLSSDYPEIVLDQISHKTFSPAKILKYLKPVLKADIDPGKYSQSKFEHESDMLLFLKDAKNLIDAERLASYRQKLKKYFNLFFAPADCMLIDIGYSMRTETILKSEFGYDVHSYSLFQNNDMGRRRSLKFAIKNSAYYNFIPKVSGALREAIFSQNISSCTGYNVDQEIAWPVFDKKYRYENPVICQIQKGALAFVSDICAIFKDYLQYMDPCFIDGSVFFENYLLSSLFDPDIYKNSYFEDEISFDDLPLCIKDIIVTTAPTQVTIDNFNSYGYRKYILLLLMDPKTFMQKTKVFIKRKLLRMKP